MALETGLLAKSLGDDEGIESGACRWRQNGDMGYIGILMMRLSWREIRRQADLPPFREYLRAARPLEVFLTLAVPAVFAASFLLPWARPGSPVSGLLGLVAFCVLWSVIAVPVVIIISVRHPEAHGKQWRYGR